MITPASFSPVKWMAQGFLPGSTARLEAAGARELGSSALVLGAWGAIGLVLCLVTFRTTSGKDS
jgi:ABC-2 type transport system permease protein